MTSKADIETIKSAIERSIKLDEITEAEVDNPSDGCEWIRDNYFSVDFAVDSNGDNDVWGSRNGWDFGVRLIAV